MKHPIHIVFCVNDLYLKYLRVTVKSIADTHHDIPVTVHILSDNISEQMKLRFINELSYATQLRIEFYDVDDSPLDGLKAWSKYTWYRLLLPTVIPADVHRVLYLDADTLVTDSLEALFATNLDDKAVAGVIDPMHFDASTYERCGYDASYGYLCAGVMLANLDYWRKHDLQAKMIEWGLANVDIKFHDQDCINYICRDCKTELPLRYGVVDALFVRDELYTPDRIDDVRDAVENPAIVHYAGKAPWLRDAAVHFFADRWHNVNRRLKPKVGRSYKAKGSTKFKIMLHDLLHPGFVRRDITLQEVKQRIIEAKMKSNE